MTKMIKEIMEQPRVLAGIEQANKDTLTKLVKTLNERKITQAVLSARGSSDHAAIYGQYLLGVYKGVSAALAAPSVITLYGGAPDMSGSLVVCISQSGKAADALAVLEKAKEQGAVTVTVTNNPSSPMGEKSDFCLNCNAGPEESVAATKTFTAQLYLMALLAAYWSGSEELLAQLRSLPAVLEKSIDQIEEDAAKHSERFRYIKEGFVLARGYAYPIALEMALKTKETCYVKMQGYASSDFYHGPIAQVNFDDPVILLAPSGAALEDARAMAERIKSMGTQIMAVTDDPALAGENEDSVLLPLAGGEAAAAIVIAVFAQCFAQYLSVGKGLNPDEPRALKKVTITK